jgi:hypothetical protein
MIASVAAIRLPADARKPNPGIPDNDVDREDFLLS